MKRADFERLVADALASIPRRFREAMRNIVIVVEGEPSPDLLADMEIEPPDTLLGLYQGFSLDQMMISSRFYPRGFGVGLPAVYLVWALAVAALYPLCRWVAGVKARRRDWWLSYV